METGIGGEMRVEDGQRCGSGEMPWVAGKGGAKPLATRLGNSWSRVWAGLSAEGRVTWSRGSSPRSSLLENPPAEQGECLGQHHRDDLGHDAVYGRAGEIDVSFCVGKDSVGHNDRCGASFAVSNVEIG